MANFRTTLWFKKGELDAAAAHDPEGPGAADLLPIEDRYADDGTVSGADRVAFSLATGSTQALDRIVAEEPHVASAPPRELIGQLKAGRLRVIAAIAGTVMIIAGALYAF